MRELTVQEAADYMAIASITLEVGRFFGGQDNETLVATCKRWIAEHQAEYNAAMAGTTDIAADMRCVLLFDVANAIAADDITLVTRATAVMRGWATIKIFEAGGDV